MRPGSQSSHPTILQMTTMLSMTVSIDSLAYFLYYASETSHHLKTTMLVDPSSYWLPSAITMFKTLAKTS